ncbi:uncharacterized protein LOC119117121 isoform X10 [Syngnathus acus]|uniref:uncharacterized protein LOC119117121 isoform X10 n=1 Tax=Syngnathus acus TaxID=161584 RepID=UPI001885F1FE|nr:uncharacterized protein LOC119117121 isoform X10 [Syngnathus acus]
MIGQVTRWACLCVLTRGRTVSSEVSSSRWARRKQESCTRASERASERASLEQRTAVDASGGGLPQNPEAAGRVLKHISARVAVATRSLPSVTPRAAESVRRRGASRPAGRRRRRPFAGRGRSYANEERRRAMSRREARREAAREYFMCA